MGFARVDFVQKHWCQHGGLWQCCCLLIRSNCLFPPQNWLSQDLFLMCMMVRRGENDMLIVSSLARASVHQPINVRGTPYMIWIEHIKHFAVSHLGIATHVEGKLLTCLPMPPRGVEGLVGEDRPLSPFSARSSALSSFLSLANATAARCTSPTEHIDLRAKRQECSNSNSSASPLFPLHPLSFLPFLGCALFHAQPQSIPNA